MGVFIRISGGMESALVDKNEYKLRMPEPCVEIIRKAFGRGRKLPIISSWL
jgi:hypothetical protein